MPTESRCETLFAVAARVLEEAAFVLVEPIEEVPGWEDELVEVELRFSGAGQGWLLMATSTRFADRLAAELLGLEPEDDANWDGRGSDALREILNMIVGPLMAVWFGESAVCEIGIPEARIVPKALHLEKGRGATCGMAVMAEDGEPIAVAAFVEEGCNP